MIQLRRVLFLSLSGISLMTGLVAGTLALQRESYSLSDAQFVYLAMGLLLLAASLLCVKSANYWISVPALVASFLVFALFLAMQADRMLVLAPFTFLPFVMGSLIIAAGLLVLVGLVSSFARLDKPFHWMNKTLLVAAACVGIYAISELADQPDKKSYDEAAIILLCSIGCAIVFFHGFQQVEQTRPADQLFEGIKLGCPRCSTVFVAPLGCMACPQCKLVLTVAVEETKELGVG